jgi:hypothetical protein
MSARPLPQRRRGGRFDRATCLRGSRCSAKRFERKQPHPRPPRRCAAGAAVRSFVGVAGPKPMRRSRPLRWKRKTQLGQESLRRARRRVADRRLQVEPAPVWIPTRGLDTASFQTVSLPIVSPIHGVLYGLLEDIEILPQTPAAINERLNTQKGAKDMTFLDHQRLWASMQKGRQQTLPSQRP